MNSVHRFGLAVGFVVLSAAASVFVAPELPEQLVTHWNAAGEPNGTMQKPLALAFLPGLMAVSLLVFAAIPRIDPLRRNIQDFRVYYDWFVVVFTVFMLVVHTGILAFNLGYSFDFTLLVVAGVALLLYYVGVLLEHAERNWFIGVRTPWTLSSDEVWRRTHDLAARLFKLTAAVAVLGLLFGDHAVYFLIVPAVATAIVTVAYSYYAYEKLGEGGDVMDAGP